MADFHPWTQVIELNWPRTVRYYQERFNFLGILEEEGLLTSFRSGEDVVAARLGDAEHEAELRPGGITLLLFQPTADFERVRRAAAQAIGLIRPKSLSRIRVSLQYLQPLVLDYDKARQASVEALYGSVLPGRSLRDFAVLLDGAADLPGGGDGRFHAEFGILSRGEVPARLSRMAGRRGSVSGQRPHAWIEKEFPEASLFVDALWEALGRIDGQDALNRMDDIHTVALEEGAGVVRDLFVGIDLEPQSDEHGSSMKGRQSL